MTAPDVEGSRHVDVEEALSQLKHDLVAVDEAVWSGLTRQLPERRGVMGRLKGAGDSRADLVACKAPVEIQLKTVPVAGASGSMWSVIGQHSAIVDLLPAGTSATAVCLAGSAVVAAVLTFQPASLRDKEAVQRLQETARAGVELSLELAQLEAALNDALANYSSSMVIRPVLADRSIASTTPSRTTSSPWTRPTASATSPCTFRGRSNPNSIPRESASPSQSTPSRYASV